MNALDAYDRIRFSEQFLARLREASSAISERTDLVEENGWMNSAIQVLASKVEEASLLLERARSLRELEAVREELAVDRIGEWVDALERLAAGITFHIGARAPVLEALFGNQKVQALRKADPKTVEAFAEEFTRRLGSSYVDRIFQQPEYAFAAPVFAQIEAAHLSIRDALSPQEITSEEATLLTEQLADFANRVDVATRQARALAEAALLPLEGAFERFALGARLKKRTRADDVQEKPESEPATEEVHASSTPRKTPPKTESDTKRGRRPKANGEAHSAN